ncbi:MAG: YigZ family protein [Acidobacteriota bacterium]
MNDPDRYPVPAGTHRVDEEIRRSRFITTIGRASTIDDAADFVRRVREEHARATHNCWAYVVGPPGATGHVGMSDDGEPRGTAGRPMLNALLHSGIGDIVAVVTRYYGGTKLGTGGLVRAYGGGVQQALASMPRAERVEWASLHVVIDYARLSVVQQLFTEHEVQIVSQEFGSEIRFDLRLPASGRDRFRAAVLDATRGQAEIRN